MAFIGYVLLILFFVLLNAFFAGSEAALTSLNKIRLRHLVESDNKKAITLNHFLKQKGGFLGTTLVGTNIAVVISTSLATQLFSTWFDTNVVAISTCTMTILILIFGEIVPKTIFRQSSDAISLKIISPLKFMQKLLFPVIFLVTSISNIILRPAIPQKRKDPKPFLSKEDIETVVKADGPKSVRGADERNLIQGIFRLGRTSLGEIMIKLENAALVNISDSIATLKASASQSRFSRFPAYESQNNNIIGTINIYDILFDKEEKASIREYLQAPLFIGTSEPVDEVLTLLRKKKKIMAIVIDQEGTSVGFVTIEDLLEEIVGEIEG